MPLSVIQKLEAIRSHFFHGHDRESKKISWVKWSKVLTPKEKGGLGVPSLYALNRGLLLKWVWRFFVQPESLWSRIIKSIHGIDGGFGSRCRNRFGSCWASIVGEVSNLKDKGTDFFDYVQYKLGNGEEIKFWEDKWCDGKYMKDLFPRLYMLENNKSVTVACKINGVALDTSFRRSPRGGVEASQLDALSELVTSITLRPCGDRLVWNLENSGVFTVASIRKCIDNGRFPGGDVSVKWIKSVPIKVNILAWKIACDVMPTRLNISRRGIIVDTIRCPICNAGVESSNHLFFSCDVARHLMQKVCKWWDVSLSEFSSFEGWKNWMCALRLPARSKEMFMGVFYCLWWWIWSFRNRSIFDKEAPRKAELFDNVISCSFNWCKFRCKASFKWDEWLKTPYLV
ncbi:RNA-directed DNA polymerase, eukaryota, reverse transcriptase zinc-binding domain protein [Tanacetum coccineum]